ncbi:hypothetical protein GTW69_21865 [Streptomyces sp. SID7760]|nr:hypothetical protein [Streptomyces sp. SID7760]
MIPRSFTVSLSTQREIWVHGNASKHIFEEIQRAGSGYMQKYKTDELVSSMVRALDRAYRDGSRYGEKILSEGWEFIVDKPRKAGDLPVLKHARRTE